MQKFVGENKISSWRTWNLQILNAKKSLPGGPASPGGPWFPGGPGGPMGPSRPGGPVEREKKGEIWSMNQCKVYTRFTNNYTKRFFWPDDFVDKMPKRMLRCEWSSFEIYRDCLWICEWNTPEGISDSCEHQCFDSVNYSVINLFLCFGWDDSFSCQRGERFVIRWTCKVWPSTSIW